MSDRSADSDTHVSTLNNGVRVLVIHLPHVESAAVSVFVRTGSGHESRRLNGISHVVEHMAFKGTATRSCQQINLDAERLGGDVNAHTDKDHTAYHMRGLARDAAAFIGMLGDIVQGSSFPAEELERERQVLLHELTDDDEDPLSAAFRLFDKLCYGAHPLAQPVIGLRGNVERFTRDDLLAYVARQYTGANVVVGVAGNVDPQAMVAAAEAAFGSMKAGEANEVSAPAYVGGIASKVQAGSSQTHIAFGFPIAPLRDPTHDAGLVAAAVFGEGMSSPLLDQIRERRGLAYYTSCSADALESSGQFVIEASTSPEHVDPFFVEVRRLLLAHADRIDEADLERARNQIMVRRLGGFERPARRLEDAALDLFIFGRVRSRAELAAGVQGASADAVRAVFAGMLAWPVAAALAGKVGKGAVDRVRVLFGG